MESLIVSALDRRLTCYCSLGATATVFRVIPSFSPVIETTEDHRLQIQISQKPFYHFDLGRYFRDFEVEYVGLKETSRRCSTADVDVILKDTVLGWEYGADVNAVDLIGQTTLHWSAVRGAIQVVDLLIEEGARVSAS